LSSQSKKSLEDSYQAIFGEDGTFSSVLFNLDKNMLSDLDEFQRQVHLIITQA
jgi:hypothetical protein